MMCCGWLKTHNKVGVYNHWTGLMGPSVRFFWEIYIGFLHRNVEYASITGFDQSLHTQPCRMTTPNLSTLLSYCTSETLKAHLL